VGRQEATVRVARRRDDGRRLRMVLWWWWLWAGQVARAKLCGLVLGYKRMWREIMD